MSDQLQRIIKKMEGDLIKTMECGGPVEKHIILLKLKQALEKAPRFGDKAVFEVGTPQRQWLAEVGALLSRIGVEKKINFQTSFSTLASYWKYSINQIMGQVADAIEEIKLELELDGRTDIGSAYAPGETYRFFADLKAIMNSAGSEIVIVDPYFNGEAFDQYLSTASKGLSIRILADRYSEDVSGYVQKHKAQFDTTIELRTSRELHDRLIFVDDDSAWIIGASIKDGGKKATYLIPLTGEFVSAKKAIYMQIWDRAKVLV